MSFAPKALAHFDKAINDYRDRLEKQPHKENETGEGIVICARKRPLNDTERDQRMMDTVTARNPIITIHDCKLKVDNSPMVENNEFCLDHTFDEGASTDEVYCSVIRPLVRLCVNDGIGTCFAYGQTGSGKTFTITGIEERAATDLFAFLEGKGLLQARSVHIGFFELAGERSYDLLHNRVECFIREDELGDIHVQNLETIQVHNAQELLHWVSVGSEHRCTRATAKNEASSRTHAICQITLRDHASKDKGKLILVDLAGSERSSDSAAHDQERQRESIAINKSLMALKECIRYRVMEMKNSSVFVPFRGSKLTMLLKESFTRRDVGTVVIVTVSPIIADANHSLNTCWFADRIKEKATNGGNTPTDPDDPHNWGKKEVADWVRSVVGPGRKTERLFTPMTGKRLCNLTIEEFAANCSIETAGRLLYDELHKLIQNAKAREQARLLKKKAEKSAAVETTPTPQPHALSPPLPSASTNLPSSSTTSTKPAIAPRTSLAPAHNTRLKRRRSVNPEDAAKAVAETDNVPHHSKSRQSLIPLPRKSDAFQAPPPPPQLPTQSQPHPGASLQLHTHTSPPLQSLPPLPSHPEAPQQPPQQPTLLHRPHTTTNTTNTTTITVSQPTVAPPVTAPCRITHNKAEFEHLYETLKQSVNDELIVGHAGFASPLKLDGVSFPLNDLSRLQQWVGYAADTYRSFIAASNRLLVSVVARVGEARGNFMAQLHEGTDREREEAWLEFYSQLRMGLSYHEVCDLAGVCQLASEYPRLFYTHVPFAMLAPFCSLLRVRFANERDFWSHFGFCETTHSYSLGEMEFVDDSSKP
ncbi:Diatom spindle kinesin-1 [Pelomyxa schiedti]|nr:Diatom spindle kinesin-1 [Pelomyxa schiedti]